MHTMLKPLLLLITITINSRATAALIVSPLDGETDSNGNAIDVVPLDSMLEREEKAIQHSLDKEYGKNKIAISHSTGFIREVRTKDGSKTFKAYVDDENWVLLLNYNRGGGDNKELKPSTLPLSLDDNSHAYPANLGIGTQEITAIRFFCKSSAHSRVVDFRSENRKIIRAFVAGETSGADSLSADDWAHDSEFYAHDRHTAYLPRSTTAAGTTDLFLHHPFYTSGSYHWNIRTWDEPSAQFRYECDDRAQGAEHATIHQVWVRVSTLKPLSSWESLAPETRSMMVGASLTLTGCVIVFACWFIWKNINRRKSGMEKRRAEVLLRA